MTTQNNQTEFARPSFIKTFAEHFHLSSTVRLSRFQRIGCIIHILQGFHMSSEEDLAVEREAAVNQLWKHEGFDTGTAQLLLNSFKGVKECFEIVWNQISDYDKALALWLNYETMTNYWPDWEIYNQALLQNVRLTSGTPESIIGAPAIKFPQSIKSLNWNQLQARTPSLGAEYESVVLCEHNAQACASRDNYFPTSQQIAVILNGLDSNFEDPVNVEDAQSLMVENGLDDELIQLLIKERSWPKRFQLVWGSMNDQSRANLIGEDWTWYDNYWPGLAQYNQILCTLIRFESKESE